MDHKSFLADLENMRPLSALADAGGLAEGNDPHAAGERGGGFRAGGCWGACSPWLPRLCYRMIGKTLGTDQPELEQPEHRTRNDQGRRPAMKTT